MRVIEVREEGPSRTASESQLRVQATLASFRPFDRLYDPSFDGHLLCSKLFSRVIGVK